MKTLYNTVQQYESILNPSQDQVMNRMTDEMIPNRIKEYCTFDRQKRRRGECWIAANLCIKNIRVGKDEKGWYVETESDSNAGFTDMDTEKTFYDVSLSKGQKIDKQKGFWIEDIDTYFRWRKHKGGIEILDAPYLTSTLGLPEELDVLYLLGNSCKKSKKLEVHNKIKVIILDDYMPDLEISGDGCKDVIINPNRKLGNITVPDGVQIHHPYNWSNYISLRKKLSGY